MRCGCRRLKERWQCHRVKAELQQRGLSADGSHDGAAALRLLPCTAQCKHVKVSPCCCWVFCLQSVCASVADVAPNHLAQETATDAKQQRPPDSARELVEAASHQQQQQLRRRQPRKGQGSVGTEDADSTLTSVLAKKLR